MSSHAASIDYVMVLVHGLMLVLFIGWSAYFVYVLIRFRSSRQPRADSAGATGRIASATEVGVVVVEAVLLVGFALPIWFEQTSPRAGQSQCGGRPRRRRAVRVERPLPWSGWPVW